MRHSLLAFVVLLCVLGSAQSSAASRVERGYEDDDVQIRLIVRTNDQLKAFYHARGFSPEAVDVILGHCIFAAIVHNKTYQRLWLELDEWRFDVGGRSVARIRRDYWPAQWAAVAMPLAHQATFGWTLMPEERDLYRDESVGGGVVLPRQSGPVTVTLRFPVGKAREGGFKEVSFAPIECPK